MFMHSVGTLVILPRKLKEAGKQLLGCVTLCCSRGGGGVGVYQAEGPGAPSGEKGGADRGAGGALRRGGNDALLVILLAFYVVHVALYAALDNTSIR